MDGSLVSLDRMTYAEAVRDGFRHLLSHHEDVFAIGQGLWSPWYVGTTMSDLDAEFGTDRIIDTPVSELACTGAAVGASLCGYRRFPSSPAPAPRSAPRCAATDRSSSTRAWISC